MVGVRDRAGQMGQKNLGCVGFANCENRALVDLEACRCRAKIDFAFSCLLKRKREVNCTKMSVNNYKELPNHLSRVELQAYEHVDAIKHWSFDTCVEVLQESVSRTKKLAKAHEIKPAAIRALIATRVRQLAQHSNDASKMQQAYHDVINTQTYLMNELINRLNKATPKSDPIQTFQTPPLCAEAHDIVGQLHHRMRMLSQCREQLEKREQADREQMYEAQVGIAHAATRMKELMSTHPIKFSRKLPRPPPSPPDSEDEDDNTDEEA